VALVQHRQLRKVHAVRASDVAQPFIVPRQHVEGASRVADDFSMMMMMMMMGRAGAATTTTTTTTATTVICFPFAHTGSVVSNDWHHVIERRPGAVKAVSNAVQGSRRRPCPNLKLQHNQCEGSDERC
jgi:hypothetical protein